jgi:diguanylate cyclase (GGDEF)-like protein
VLLPSTNKTVTYNVAEKLRELVSNTLLPVIDNEISLSISIRLSEIDLADENQRDIVKRADDNLYTAKQTGRNKVCGD